jgi:hypothetical protein
MNSQISKMVFEQGVDINTALRQADEMVNQLVAAER